MVILYWLMHSKKDFAQLRLLLMKIHDIKVATNGIMWMWCQFLSRNRVIWMRITLKIVFIVGITIFNESEISTMQSLCCIEFYKHVGITNNYKSVCINYVTFSINDTIIVTRVTMMVMTAWYISLAIIAVVFCIFFYCIHYSYHNVQTKQKM